MPLPAGFGFLVPPNEVRSKDLLDPAEPLLLACTFTDQKFADRVPAGGRMLRAFFGGKNGERMCALREIC